MIDETRNTRYEILDTCNERLATSDQRLSPNGFTLLEIVGVLALIGMLAALILPSLINRIDDATRTAEAANLKAIAQAVEMYLEENRVWPANLPARSPEYIQSSCTEPGVYPNGRRPAGSERWGVSPLLCAPSDDGHLR